MKYILQLLVLLTSLTTVNAQFTVKRVIKPSNGACDGRIVLEFQESELPGTLLAIPSDPEQNENSMLIKSTLHTIYNLCPGGYTFTFKDNHQCEETDFIDLEACSSYDLDFMVETDFSNCNFTSPFSILPNFEDYQNYYYQWSTGSMAPEIHMLSEGTYSVTVMDEFKCSSVNQIEVGPLENVFEDDLEIIPTKVELANLGNLGNIEITTEGGKEPLSFEWTATDPAAINMVAENGLSATLNYIDYYADVIVTVTDGYGCKTEKIITLETCAGNTADDFDVFYNPFELTKCSEVFEGEMYFDIEMESNYINYEVSKHDGNATWDLLQNGVVKQESSVLTFMYNEAGKYKIFFFNECGFTYEREINLLCKDDEADCLGIANIVEASTYHVDDECNPDWHHIWFNLSAIIDNCIENSSQNGYCEQPLEILLKYSDGGIYKVYVNENDEIEVEAINESENVSTDIINLKLYLKYEGDPDEVHSVQVSLNSGCVHTEKLDVRTLDYMNTVWFAGIGEFNGIQAQCVNVRCNTCKHQIEFSKDFIDGTLSQWEPGWNYTPYENLCKDPYFSAFQFEPGFPNGVWDPSTNLTPFDYGGSYKMLLGPIAFQEVTIPAGTPYVMLGPDEGLKEHSGSDWVRCIYAQGYASDPAYRNFPIYVAYSEEVDWTVYTFEPPAIIDVECADEWVTSSVEFCKKDVVCLDDNPPTFIGTIPDVSSLIPCKLNTSSGCIVVGFCTESDDYYYSDEGEYYVFEDLSCNDVDVMDCIDNSDPTSIIDCDEDHPCPNGQFCQYEKCHNCPVFTYTDLYGNNNDCIYNFDFFTDVDIPIFGVVAKTYRIDPGNNETLVHTLHLSFGPGGDSKSVNVAIPGGCVAYNVKITLEFENCPIYELIAPNTVNCGDCIVDNSKIGEYSSSAGKEKEIMINDSEEILKNENQFNNEIDCLLYPNPFSDSFTLESENDILNKVFIHNSLGEIIRSEKSILNNSHIIKMDNIPPGVYFVTVTFTNGKTKVFKALKI
ncbi:MAG: T9SS type A sorting domain-containing protein [Bacteroidota bacterium]